MQAEIDELMRQRALERQALGKVEQLPEKAKRQSESTINMMKALQGQADAALNRLNEAEAAYKVANNHERELQEEYNRTLNTLDRQRVQVEAKERHADDIRKDVELASIEADKILADQVDLDLKIRNTLADARAEQDQLNRKMREKEVAMRQLKQAQAALQEATDMLPNLRFQVEQLQRDKAVLNAHMNQELKQTEELRRDLDIAMSDFLQEENVGKEKAAIFQLTFKQVALHEEELRGLKHDEASRASILADLSSQRDRVALSIAQKLAKVNLKDRLLGQSRSQHASAVMDRDTLRIELGKLGALFRAKQSGVDEQIAEVDKLNAIINSAEKDMLRLRKQYELVIEGRNYTGIMLMDRNDELCILYEKSNIQVSELERAVNATRKVVPHIPVLDGDVARLQQALLEARRESEVLSHALENPSNFGRWRLLEGKTPDKEELVAKIQHLEQRLNDRKEALLEKELILEEVTRLSDKLRAQASEGRSDTFELARHVSEHQSRLRAATRKIMATVSELSMYQATAMKLSAEREELIATVGVSRERFEQGLAPTEDAEREWFRLLREEATLADLAEQRVAEAKALDSKVFETTSTAEPRPNAYIPEEIGIPKPYGVFTPFKPSDPGSTMRHIRKPQPKEIVI
ncbi:coiled-coil flagellar protein, move backward only 2 [Dunaliella salina]|uniref:Coiled-coil flagellar protein, move backward only 2 n=1 Tax=Dunaliella salina TaxID=3046 RepID=A0ABQ7GLS7_DUNSA|nr:coiled-coil flagellar protein, move backward only 2 [Dunaliella salina]|eukprot:KAF5835566.1 coiled-coil flagellar protein, move backward only 2 [Dunaliella salina]